MDDEDKRWKRAAKATGGLAAVLTLLAHFWIPSLPLTAIRVEILLFLIGVLLGLDIITENVPVPSGIQSDSTENEGQEHD